MNHVTNLLISADISIFSSEISKFCYIRKYRYRLHFSISFLILLIFFESLKIFLKNIVKILMMSAKLATPGLLNIKIFRNKGYDVIILDYDINNKILSHGLNHIVDMIKWPKIGNSSFSMREVIITSTL